MTMPIDLILVRHGQSEGNIVIENMKRGDTSLHTETVRNTPNYQWRLTEQGREQARSTGEWINRNIGTDIGRYYASPFIRTQETAGLLGLPDARWRLDQRLRERDWGEINSVPAVEHIAAYPRNAAVKSNNAVYWRPPAGESIADARMRVRNFLDTLHRDASNDKVIVVTHGEFISATRAVIEDLSDDEWKRRDDDPEYKIYNAHVVHFSRRDPITGKIGPRVGWVRCVCPHEGLDTGWADVSRKYYSNDDLIKAAFGVGTMLFQS